NRMPPGRNTEEFSSAAGIIKYILSLERDPYRYLENPSVTKSESQRSVSSRPAQDSAKPIQPKGSGESQIGGIFDSIKNTFRDLF
ncbi:MAG: cell division protein FtsA, partial [Synergistes sp.]|nr:cell division protein FtsA [Synergistes sp.]